MADIVLKEEAYKIVGACFEVHNELGAGFLEAVYQESLEQEFRSRGIPFQSQPCVPIAYKGSLLTKTYQPDFVCFEQVIVEIKSVSELAEGHRAQVINYLKASGLPLGLLINFGESAGLQHERFALTRHRT